MKRHLSLLLMAMLALAWTAAAESITIDLNFNATALTAGNYMWFNAIMNPPDTIKNTDPLTLAVTNSVIHVWNANKTIELYTLTAPGNNITLAQNTTDSVTAGWTTTAWSGTGNPPDFFLDGYAWQIPTNLPGDLSIVWTMDIATSTGDTGYTYQYQGAAAQYASSTNFNMANAGVTAAGGDAGVPTTYAVNGNVVGGGTGGGGSNWTGSMSGTHSVTINDPIVPEPGPIPLISLGAVLIAGAQWVTARRRRV